MVRKIFQKSPVPQGEVMLTGERVGLDLAAHWTEPRFWSLADLGLNPDSVTCPL